MKLQSLAGAIIVSTITTASLIQANPAQALSFKFSNIPTNNTTGDSLTQYLSGDVNPYNNNGAFGALFQISFASTAPAGAFIGQIYFDDSTSLLTNPSPNIGNVSINGVNYVPTSGNLPQGNNLIPDFTADFGFNRVTGNGNINAVQAGETFGVFFQGDYTNIVTALNSGALRVGLHVQGIAPSDGSDAFVSTTPIPTPALLPGLVAMGLGVLRKKKQLPVEGGDLS